MELLSKALRTLPEPVREPLRGTPFESAYHHLVKRDVELTPVRVQIPAGPIRFQAPTGSIIVRNIEDSGSYEPVLTEAICERVDESTVVYDIGSRYGYYSTLALACGALADRVHCFEADIRNHYILEQNHSGNAVNLNRIRVGADSGKGRISIDDYSAGNPAPTLVKIDVEGAEYDVLCGMNTCLEYHEPEIFVEMHPHRLPEFGATSEDVFEVLRRAGYTIRIETDHRRFPTKWTHVSDAKHPTERTYLLHASE